jgi:hypothetical protein
VNAPDDISEAFTWLEQPEPSKGDQLLLLTSGKIPVIGKWSRTGGFTAWAVLPKKASYYEASVHMPPSGNLLILNPGGIPIISHWRNGCGFTKWHPLPKKVEN